MVFEEQYYSDPQCVVGYVAMQPENRPQTHVVHENGKSGSMFQQSSGREMAANCLYGEALQIKSEGLYLRAKQENMAMYR